MTTKYNHAAFAELLFDHVFYWGITDEFIDSVLTSIPERESMVLKLRFGLNCKRQTLEDIGKNMDNLTLKKRGINRERVRQLEAKALRKLRWRPRADSFITNLIKNLTGIDEPVVIASKEFDELKNKDAKNNETK